MCLSQCDLEQTTLFLYVSFITHKIPAIYLNSIYLNSIVTRINELPFDDLNSTWSLMTAIFFFKAELKKLTNVQAITTKALWAFEEFLNYVIYVFFLNFLLE